MLTALAVSVFHISSSFKLFALATGFPEIDAASAVSAIAFLGGAALVIRGRHKR